MTFYGFARAIVLSACRVAFRVQVVGRDLVPRSGVYVVAPSHRSVLDIPFTAFITRRRIRFMAKKELFSSRFGAWLFDALGAIRVDREATDRAALRACQEALEAGEPVAVFPEGTRGHGPQLSDLFDGAAYLAVKLGIPIVPVGIGASEEILAKGRWIPRFRKVHVVVGEPIGPPRAAGPVRRSDVAAVTKELAVRLQECFDAANAAGP